MRFQQIRNATTVMEYAGVRLLFDPWLDAKEACEPFHSPWPERNGLRSPLVGLPMPVEEVLAVCKVAPNACVIASHMDTVNHGNVSRKYLRTFADFHGVGEQVLIPADGESLQFS